MSLSTIIVSTILILIILRISLSLYKDHKKGGCSSDCASCGSHCQSDLVNQYHQDQKV